MKFWFGKTKARAVLEVSMLITSYQQWAGISWQNQLVCWIKVSRPYGTLLVYAPADVARAVPSTNSNKSNPIPNNKTPPPTREGGEKLLQLWISKISMYTFKFANKLRKNLVTTLVRFTLITCHNYVVKLLLCPQLVRTPYHFLVKDVVGCCFPLQLDSLVKMKAAWGRQGRDGNHWDILLHCITSEGNPKVWDDLVARVGLEHALVSSSLRCPKPGMSC